MSLPKTIWSYSLKNEAVRLLQTAHYIKNLFYVKNGFFILPYNIPQNPKIIYFPKLPYKKINHFWQIAQKGLKITCLKNNDRIINETKVHLLSKPIDFSQLQLQWRKIEKPVWDILNQIIPSYLKSIRNLEIRITRYGSITTCFSTLIKDKNKVIIYLREDADCSHIVEGILIDRLYRLGKSEYRSWEQMEAIIDFVLTETALNKIMPLYKPTLNHLQQKQQGILALESNKYLKTLGIASSNLFRIEKNQILIQDKKVNCFSANEEKVLKYLICYKNTFVSFDVLSDIIWGKDSFDKYSLFAIAKLIQRIREKISHEGLFPEVIQTGRKKGYILVD